MTGEIIGKVPESAIEPLPIPPLVEEILKQQRMILENLQELTKYLAHPVWLVKEDKK